MKKEASIQSKGGAARAEKLTQKQRSEIAARAASARWLGDFPKATHEGEIMIGDNLIIPCAVLEDGTRVITQQGMYSALGRTKTPNKQGLVAGRPGLIGANNLTPFISNDLKCSWDPVKFRPVKGSGGVNGVALGYKAEILPMICHVFEDAERAGKILPNQQHVAEAARIISRSFSKLGVIALVDEATGFQYDRARDALAKILEKFIAKELRPWTRTFPIEFYEQIFRLKGWTFDPATMQGPRCLAQMTDDVVYNRLAPDVLKHLREKNPVIDGRRKHKHFQWLTGDIGHPRLLAHLEGVKILMRESSTWEEFHAKLDRHYPIFAVTPLGMTVNLSRKPGTLTLTVPTANSSSPEQTPSLNLPSAESA